MVQQHKTRSNKTELPLHTIVKTFTINTKWIKFKDVIK